VRLGKNPPQKNLEKAQKNRGACIFLELAGEKPVAAANPDSGMAQSFNERRRLPGSL
jgi:hypothetical protein